MSTGPIEPSSFGPSLPGGSDDRSALETPFSRFQAQRFFSPLDGLRALSVVLVVTWHMPSGQWSFLGGDAGVTAFFVLSGFLITTLCLRESGRTGTIGLRGFYIRRAFRILPLYFLCVAVYGGLALGTNIVEFGAYEDRLPYLLAMSADLDWQNGPMAHAWSLGVEEKFYLVWPPVLLVLARRQHREQFAAVAALVFALCLLRVAGSQYAGFYIGIATGCAVAVALADQRLFALLHRVLGIWPLAVALAITTLIAQSLLHTFALLPVYCALVALVLVRLLLFEDPVSRLFSAAPMQWIGRRSYAIYLFHPIVIALLTAIQREQPDESLPASTLRLALALGLTFGLADALHRFVESPLIAQGRAFASRRPAKLAQG